MALIYSGAGSYNPETKWATYKVILPDMPTVTYKFGEIYNFTTDDNKILIFMEMTSEPGDDPPLDKWTNDIRLETVEFSLNKVLEETGCSELTPGEDIEIIILHDDEKDRTYARNTFFGKESMPESKNKEAMTGREKQSEPGMPGGMKWPGTPKKSGFGTLKPIKP